MHGLPVQWLTTPCILSNDRPFDGIDAGNHTAVLIQGDAGAFVSSTTLVTVDAPHVVYSWSITLLEETMSPSRLRIVWQGYRTQRPVASCPHSRAWDRPTN